jgi:hypothetical protein
MGGEAMQQEFLWAALAPLVGAALVLWLVPWKRIDSWLDPQEIDPQIEREFNRVFMTTSEEGKQALIKRWTKRKKCGRGEAMRLAIEELRRANR